jgi:hypothetical protein
MHSLEALTQVSLLLPATLSSPGICLSDAGRQWQMSVVMLLETLLPS